MELSKNVWTQISTGTDRPIPWTCPKPDHERTAEQDQLRTCVHESSDFLK